MDNVSIVCFKYGTKYDDRYVQVLYNMVKRHCSLNFKFYCITDDLKQNIDNVNSIYLDNGLVGWWNKLYIFSPEFPVDGPVLYLDLDIVIHDNIDEIVSFAGEDWVICQDFTRARRVRNIQYNSSVFKFTPSAYMSKIWNQFIHNRTEWEKQYHGDQDIMWKVYPGEATLFPKEWIKSYKWEIRTNNRVTKGNRGGKTAHGTADFCTRQNIYDIHGSKLYVFHGDPKPASCKDQYVIDNWK